MFDLAGGHRMSRNVAEPRSIWFCFKLRAGSKTFYRFCSNWAFGAKLFLFFVQTERLEQNSFCFLFKLSVCTKTFLVFCSNWAFGPKFYIFFLIFILQQVNFSKYYFWSMVIKLLMPKIQGKNRLKNNFIFFSSITNNFYAVKPIISSKRL